jgi:hypothetical protein
MTDEAVHLAIITSSQALNESVPRNAYRSAGQRIITLSSRRGIDHPPAPGQFRAVAVAGLAQFIDKPLEGLSWLVGQ